MAAEPPSRSLPSHADRPSSPLVTSGFCLFLVMMVLNPYMTSLESSGDGNPLRQLLYVVALGMVVVGMQPWRRGIGTLALPLYLLIILGWCCFSLTWSIAPGIAVRRLLLTVIVMLTLLYAMRDLKFASTVKSLRVILLLTLILNWVAVVAFPQVGVHQFSPEGDEGIVGAWCGILLQKNFAGAACVMTILVFIFGHDPRARWPWLRWLTILLAAIFLWGTQSKTSAGIGAASLLAGLLFGVYNPRYRALLIPVTIVLTVGIVFFVNLYWDDIVAPLYDPHAFTGRTQIWPGLFTYMRDHPMGSGFGSFWNIGPGLGPMFHYSRGWISELSSGHNGYLDTAVTIGLPGLALAILCMFLWPIGKLLASVTAAKMEGGLALSLILFSIGHNFTESTLLERDSFVQIMLMLGIALVELTTRRRRGGTYVRALA